MLADGRSKIVMTPLSFGAILQGQKIEGQPGRYRLANIKGVSDLRAESTGQRFVYDEVVIQTDKDPATGQPAESGGATLYPNQAAVKGGVGLDAFVVPFAHAIEIYTGTHLYNIRQTFERLRSGGQPQIPFLGR